MNTITIEKKSSGENLTNRTGGDGPYPAKIIPLKLGRLSVAAIFFSSHPYM